VGVLFNLPNIQYVQLDNFEFTGLCWNSGNSFYVTHYGSNYDNSENFMMSNLYIHGWTHTSFNCSGGGACDGSVAIYSSISTRFGSTIDHVVVDGSDSDDTSFGGVYGDGYIVQYSVFRHLAGSSVPTACHQIHDNLFEYANNTSDSSEHTDVWMCYGEYGDGAHPHGSDTSPNLFYNNVFRFIGTTHMGPLSAVLWLFPPSGQTDYEFNNVFHDYYGVATNYNNYCQGGCGNLALFNNTMEQSLPNYTGCIVCNGSAPGSSISSVNNHWIGTATTPGSVFQSTTGVTESAPLYQTIGAANAQGYTSANDFAPSSSSSPTVTAAGVNETAGFCRAFADPAAVSSCKSGTTLGCSYNSTNHTVNCPKAAGVSRPAAGAWNVGAYQFGGATSSLAPPTAVIATAD
jgi:hypothetical protein